MNKTKIVLTAFAVFASVLMLMTAALARPVQESTTNDFIESQQNQLIIDSDEFFNNVETNSIIAIFLYYLKQFILIIILFICTVLFFWIFEALGIY